MVRTTIAEACEAGAPDLIDTGSVAGEQIRLTVVGLAVSGTGFTRVLTALVGRLSNRYRIDYFGLARFDDEVQVPEGVHYHPCMTRERHSETVAQLTELVRAVAPHVVLLLGQPWRLAPLLDALDAMRDRLKVVLYMPLEGMLADPAALLPLRCVDHCLLYTEFARADVTAALRCLAESDPDFNPPELHVLPHGVETDLFSPRGGSVGNHFTDGGRAPVRRSIFADMPRPENAFIVLNANYPYLRKRLDLTIRGFGLFAEGKPPDVYLCLHCVRLDRYHRRQLLTAVDEAGIADRLLLNPIAPRGIMASDRDLNMLYNACDVGINTAMGEGWGLVSFEHAATGAAQIVPDHTSFRENWGGAAELLDVAGEEYLSYEHTRMFAVFAEDVARKLERLYRDENHRHRMSTAAYERAAAGELQWTAVADRLDGLLRRALRLE